MTEQLAAEDEKLLTLARGARGRVGAPEGAALRDETGRTYASASVTLPSLHLSALQAVVAQAVAAGARGVEAALLVVDDGGVDADGSAAVRDLGGVGVNVLAVDAQGEVHASRT
jgi:hypothetical protein